jgi:hypothetical protein
MKHVLDVNVTGTWLTVRQWMRGLEAANVLEGKVVEERKRGQQVKEWKRGKDVETIRPPFVRGVESDSKERGIGRCMKRKQMLMEMGHLRICYFKKHATESVVDGLPRGSTVDLRGREVRAFPFFLDR